MAEREGFELEAPSGRERSGSPAAEILSAAKDLSEMAEREGFEPSIQVFARITV